MELKGDKLIDEYYKLKKKNVFISPLSLFIALGMLTNGADGDTKQKLETYLEDDIESINDFIREYLDELPEVISIASSVWSRNISIKEGFNEKLDEYYDSGIKHLTNIDAVNDWVKDNTNGKIDSILDSLSESDVLLLLNAIYFKDDWMSPFEKKKTKITSFKNLDGPNSDIPMMFSKEEFYYENDFALAFAKQYESRISFVGILPKKEGDFNLSDLNIDELLRNRSYTDTFIGLPKLNFDDNIDFMYLLKQIGLDNTNLSNLTDENINVSKFVQKTSVTIDEQGSEAAGVTCIGMRKCCFIPTEPKYIYLDRPFAFVIYDNLYDIPLFIGKIIHL